MRTYHPIKQLKSIRYASEGIWHFFKTEPKALIHLGFDFIIVILGLLTPFDKIEWLFIIAGMVNLLAVEILNTCVEDLCNFIQPDKHKSIKVIKDMAAAAVYVLALYLGILTGYFVISHLA